MPRYRRKFREPQNLDEFSTFLSKLSKNELKTFQDIARHMKGEDVGYSKKVPRKPYKKVLPGVWDDILRAESGTQLAGGIISEAHEHTHNPHFHSGGGLWDGLSVLGHTGWNYLTSAVGPLGWLQDKWDSMMNYKGVKDLPLEIRQQVDGISQAKLPVGERAKTLHGWTYNENLSTDRVAVYVDAEQKQVNCIVRGTNKTSITDIYEDYKILTEGSPDTEEVRAALVKVSNEYGKKYDLSCVAYSLGGGQSAAIFTGEKDKVALDEFDQIILVSPGGSPFVGDEMVKDILADPRTTLLTNRSDVISGIYTQNSDPDHTYYGPHSWGPMESHKVEQWGTEDNWRDESASGPIISTQAVATAAAAYTGLKLPGVAEKAAEVVETATEVAD